MFPALNFLLSTVQMPIVDILIFISQIDIL